MDPRVRDGLALLRARDWFEAHEVLEGPWREAEGERRLFLQALIQGAVALEHLRRGNPRGAWGQWRKARDKAAKAPAELDGVHLAAWMEQLDGFFETIAVEERAHRQLAGKGAEGLPALPPVDGWPLP